MTLNKEGNIIMNLRDCYNNFGGNYDDVLSRLRREQTIEKFIYKFLNDESFKSFEKSMENKDYAEALRAVHTLKGICQNLSFTKLYESSAEMTDALKKNDPHKAIAMIPKLLKDYYQTIYAIEEYKKIKEE